MTFLIIMKMQPNCSERAHTFLSFCGTSVASVKASDPIYTVGGFVIMHYSYISLCKWLQEYLKVN